jgi:hypothetical protein
VGLHKAGGWGREGDVHHHPVIAMEPDHHLLKLGALLLVSSNWRSDGPYIATAVLQDLNPSEDRGPKMLGTAGQAVGA